MILYKTWITVKKNRYDTYQYNSVKYKNRESYWEGYFLLGFIPLYVKLVRVRFYD